MSPKTLLCSMVGLWKVIGPWAPMDLPIDEFIVKLRPGENRGVTRGVICEGVCLPAALPFSLYFLAAVK